MKAVNRFFIMLFCFVVGGICSIVGVVLNSVKWEGGFIPADIQRRLSWFGENPETTSIIVWVLWGGALVLAVLGVISLVGIIKDRRTTADTDLGIEYKRIED